MNGKTKKSLEVIAQILERSRCSVQSRCEKLFSSNEYDRIKGARKDWDYAEDGKLVDNIFKLKKIKINTFCLNEQTKFAFHCYLYFSSYSK